MNDVFNNSVIVRQAHPVYYYFIGFVSFIVAVKLQGVISSVLSSYISMPVILDVATVFVMWVLASFVLTRIGHYLLLSRNP